ncbi:MAG: hypothetical protein AB7O64_17780 [Methylibium sp.]
MTVDEARSRIEGLDHDTARSVICALLGHSKVQKVCFGYWYCGRCETQIGDSLASTFDGSRSVVVDHHCDVCRQNLAGLTDADRLLLPDDVVTYLSELADTKLSKRRAAAAKRRYEKVMAAARKATK